MAKKNSMGFFHKVKDLFARQEKLTIETLDQLEMVLLKADVGLPVTVAIIDDIEKKMKENKGLSLKELHHELYQTISRFLNVKEVHNIPPSSPYVTLIVGVNGSGKTTSLAKLAYNEKQAGKTVIMGAGDTFRAAAVEQLVIWAKRIDVPIITKPKGFDPASVAYETVSKAVENQIDTVFIDTAGRLHNNTNLMNELQKVMRVIGKLLPQAPHQILLVIDGTTGQNAIEQAKQFKAFMPIHGIIITKLDGTTKAGIALPLCYEHHIPIKYICTGEKIEDIKPFDAQNYAEMLLSSS